MPLTGLPIAQHRRRRVGNMTLVVNAETRAAAGRRGLGGRRAGREWPGDGDQSDSVELRCARPGAAELGPARRYTPVSILCGRARVPGLDASSGGGYEYDHSVRTTSVTSRNRVSGNVRCCFTSMVSTHSQPNRTSRLRQPFRSAGSLRLDHRLHPGRLSIRRPTECKMGVWVASNPNPQPTLGTHSLPGGSARSWTPTLWPSTQWTSDDQPCSTR